VWALPVEGGPVQVKVPRVIVDPWGFRLIDPDGNYIGSAGIWVNRMLGATKTTNTRRL
jgi:hypothetical protein